MPNNTRKHVTLIEVEGDGGRSFVLLGPTGQRLPSFTSFDKSLRSAPYNTRRRYCISCADFFDYYFQSALQLIGASDDPILSKDQLLDVIDYWKSFLTEGASSDIEFVRKVALALGNKVVSPVTAANKHAALSRFLHLSERHRLQSQELAKVNGSSLGVDYEPLMAELHHLRAISGPERAEMLRTSMLSSVISSGQSSRAIALFDSVAATYDVNKAFPLDRAEEFIGELRSFRDKTIFSWLAASGSRAHEGLQMLWGDIDIPNGEVKLISPFSRMHTDPSYAILSKSERQHLSWKGRETSSTFLIEPFASMFFENLEKYHREEYYPHGRHQFVFQTLRGDLRGTPYFLSDVSTRQQVFDTAAKKIGLDDRIDGVHSFRHAYGTYLLNYFPLPNDEYGLPIGLVRVAMGHANIKSTEKYAVVDKEMLAAKFQLANLEVFRKGRAQGQLDFKINVLEKQIEKLREMQREYD